VPGPLLGQSAYRSAEAQRPPRSLCSLMRCPQSGIALTYLTYLDSSNEPTTGIYILSAIFLSPSLRSSIISFTCQILNSFFPISGRRLDDQYSLVQRQLHSEPPYHAVVDHVYPGTYYNQHQDSSQVWNCAKSPATGHRTLFSVSLSILQTRCRPMLC
jgi:hypothetical protein